MGKLLIYCYSITFFEIIVIVSAIKKIVIATYSGTEFVAKKLILFSQRYMKMVIRSICLLDIGFIHIKVTDS